MPPLRIPARNIVHLQRAKQGADWYVERISDARLKGWRERLAPLSPEPYAERLGPLTPDMMTANEREQLQTWIVEHPKVTR